jgi:hypothetical protein
MATYKERLLKVQNAIDQILVTGQSTQFGDRTLTKADLNALRELEQDYTARAAGEANAATGGGRARLTYVTPLSK